MSQQKFANALGVSVGLIRSYEAGTRVSEASLEAMKSLAVASGLADLAMQMSGDFAVGKVLLPDGGTKVRLRKASHGRDLSDDLHEALDTILNQGTPDAIGSIEFLLRTTKEQIDRANRRK